VELINQNINTIRSLCRKHNVAQLFVFGSVLDDSFDSSSDIDFIVDFNDISLEQYADNYFNLKNALEDLFQRNVDLLEDQAIKNPFLRSSIDSTKKIIYPCRIQLTF
jgi:predicted nucleotidyltransferase